MLQSQRYKKESCAFQIGVSQERHIKVYLATITTQQDFDVLYVLFWCGYLYKSGFDKVLGPPNELFVYIPE